MFRKLLNPIKWVSLKNESHLAHSELILSHWLTSISQISKYCSKKREEHAQIQSGRMVFFHLFTRNLLSTNANIEFPLVAQPVLSQRTEGMESNCFCGSKMGSSKNQFMLNHVIDLNRPLQFCLSTYLQHHCWWWFIGC